MTGIWCIIQVMTTSDGLNIVLTIGFIVIVTCIGFLSYFFIQALRSITKLADNLEDTTADLNFLKNKLKFKALTAFSAILAAFLTKLIKKRG